jgi:hypothetical protein
MTFGQLVSKMETECISRSPVASGRALCSGLSQFLGCPSLAGVIAMVNLKFNNIFDLLIGLSMNNISSVIDSIVTSYLRPCKNKGLKTVPHKRRLFQSRESILELYEPYQYFVADEVLEFYLAINAVILDDDGYLLNDKTPGFSLFPFSLVFPDAPLNLLCPVDPLRQFELIESHICLFQIEKFFLCTPSLKTRTAEAPIYLFAMSESESEGTIWYSSLTHLLLMVAECYEEGAYYYDKSASCNCWKEDFGKSKVIFHKYHFGLPFRSPNKLDEW